MSGTLYFESETRSESSRTVPRVLARESRNPRMNRRRFLSLLAQLAGALTLIPHPRRRPEIESIDPRQGETTRLPYLTSHTEWFLVGDPPPAVRWSSRGTVEFRSAELLDRRYRHIFEKHFQNGLP